MRHRKQVFAFITLLVVVRTHANLLYQDLFVLFSQQLSSVDIDDVASPRSIGVAVCCSTH